MAALCGIAVLLAGAAGAASAPEADAPPPLELTFSSVPGIPRNVVPSLAQDASGLLWVGTGDGLARYDGYRLQMVERDGKDALERNMGWVRAMLPTPDGRLWIGTESSGLAVFEPDTRRIRIIGGPKTGPQDAIVALARDGEGHLWIGTLGGGVLRHAPESDAFEPIALPGQPPGEGQGLALAVAPDGTIWVGHWQGLARWQPGTAGLEPIALPPTADGTDPGPVTSLLATEAGTLWLGSQNGQLARGQDADEWSWLPSSGRGIVRSLALDDAGRLWAGHSAGIDLVRASDGSVLQRLVHRPDHPAGLAGNEITQVLRDPTGAMWVAGFGVGLQRHQSHPAIVVRGSDPEQQGPLRNADVRALLQRRRGDILAATHSGSIARLDADLRMLGALVDAGPPVDAMAEDAEGRLWLASRGQVAQHDGDGRPLARWDTQAGNPFHLSVDAEGTAWLGAERGLLRKRRDEAGFVLLTDTQGQTLEREVFDVIHDGAGGLWVGGRAGLHRLRKGADRLERVEAVPGHALGFPLVLGLLRDRQGTLWVDTPVAGLHRVTGEDAQGRLRFEPVSVRLGVVGRPFGANLHEDARGRIWSQAFVYDPAADRLDELRPADGVQFGTPWFRSHTKLADGRLLFGGSRGLLRVDPARFDPSREQPPLVFTSFRMDGLPHEPRSMAEGLVLPPGTRSFGVEFAALEYADPERVKYRYRLVGFDPEWLPTDASFRAPSYSQLPPGHYRLEVQATNRSGLWSPETLGLTVVVQPAWWQGRWVPWALALGVTALVWLLIRWRTGRLQQQQSALERLVRERTEELRQASLTDPLTGLGNRRRLMQSIEAELAAAADAAGESAEEGRDLLVFLIDLDHFKAINDRFGHAAGDAVLVRTAKALRRVFRDSDPVVRWGGEEFLVVARGCERRHAAELAERLRRELAQPALDGAPEGPATPAVTASFGFVAFPPDPGQPAGWTWDGVLQLADAALYAAKADGRNAWVGVLTCPVDAKNGGGATEALQHPGTVTLRSS